MDTRKRTWGGREAQRVFTQHARHREWHRQPGQAMYTHQVELAILVSLDVVPAELAPPAASAWVFWGGRGAASGGVGVGTTAAAAALESASQLLQSLAQSHRASLSPGRGGPLYRLMVSARHEPDDLLAAALWSSGNLCVTSAAAKC